jgi:hypothetical protein
MYKWLDSQASNFAAKIFAIYILCQWLANCVPTDFWSSSRANDNLCYCYKLGLFYEQSSEDRAIHLQTVDKT